MATDPSPALRKELQAALDIIEPQIRGLSDLVTTSISFELQNILRTTLQDREHRAGLIKRVLSNMDQVMEDLDRLMADGYPALDPVQLNPDLLDELNEEVADVKAGESVFASAKATNLEIRFGKPVAKPQA